MNATQSSPSGANFWQPHIHAWQQSGLSGAQFCKRHQLTYHQFIYWRQKLTHANEPAARSVPPAPTRFAEVRLAADAGPDETQGLSLALPHGWTLHGITATNVTVALQLLAAL